MEPIKVGINEDAAAKEEPEPAAARAARLRRELAEAEAEEAVQEMVEAEAQGAKDVDPRRAAYAVRSRTSRSSITACSAGISEGAAWRPHALVCPELDSRYLTPSEAAAANSPLEYPFEDHSADPESESACASEPRPSAGEQDMERDGGQTQARPACTLHPYTFEVSVQPGRLEKERAELIMGPAYSDRSTLSTASSTHQLSVSVKMNSDEASTVRDCSRRHRSSEIAYDEGKSSGKIVGSAVTFEATPGRRSSRASSRDSRCDSRASRSAQPNFAGI